MTRRILDLFCGEGGAGWGYHLAGFEVVGLDIDEQPGYPFEFHRADALKLRRDRLDGCWHIDGCWHNWACLGRFDAIHGSPPCQAFTSLKAMHNAGDHADLLTPFRALLDEIWDGPRVIENVPGAPMDGSHVTLCGSSLALGVERHDRQLRRHRHFECNFPVLVPPCAHGGRATIGIYGDHARDRRRKPGVRDRGVDFPDAEKMELAREALGMPWATRWAGLTQAIPPAMTEVIGGYLLAEINARAAA